MFVTPYVVLLLCLPSDEALRLLKRAQCRSQLILAETHPLQGELADAMARAYATVGENNNYISMLAVFVITVPCGVLSAVYVDLCTSINRIVGYVCALFCFSFSRKCRYIS